MNTDGDSMRPPDALNVLQLRGVEGARTAVGVAVVIDVLRAFTSAAYAFAGGAERILLVGTVEAAEALQARYPDALRMGEVGGRTIPGFALNNSPSHVRRADLRGRTMIQRTGAGTPCAVAATGADEILLASFVVAGATARYALGRRASAVSLIATAAFQPPPNEDDACAGYLARLLRGEWPDAAHALATARAAPTTRLFVDPDEPDLPAGDLALAFDIDRFDFAMPVVRDGDLLVARRVDGP